MEYVLSELECLLICICKVRVEILLSRFSDVISLCE